MEYFEMSDLDINKKVATLLHDQEKVTVEQSNVGFPSVTIYADDWCKILVDYCNNPNDAHPIIEREKIGIQFDEVLECWVAQDSLKDYIVEDVNPLRAAMIILLTLAEDRVGWGK